MTLTELQAQADAYVTQYEVGYFPVFENLARLSEEVGELAREVSHTHGGKKKKASEADGSAREELGDTLFVLACLANQLGVNLDEALEFVFEKYARRDVDRWPRRAVSATPSAADRDEP